MQYAVPVQYGRGRMHEAGKVYVHININRWPKPTVYSGSGVGISGTVVGIFNWYSGIISVRLLRSTYSRGPVLNEGD
jgi:hypothetical protein